MKVLVVHPAQQHSYRLATALKRKGYLYKYVTTVYYKSGSLTKLVSCFLRGDYKEKACGRRCAELDDEDVVQLCEAGGLIKLMSLNIPVCRRFYRSVKYHNADRFAKKVVNYAIQNKVDAVVGYDDFSSVLFEMLAKEAPDILRIMDVSAANILYMRQIYDMDIKLKPAFAARLRSERQIVWNPDNINRTMKELKYTQLFLAPSTFVARSLEYSGIVKKQIWVCPYGVDTDLFGQKTYQNLHSVQRPIRFVYVGGVKELKGISYLLEAIQQIPEDQAELTIVGKVDHNAEDILPYLERVKFTGSVLHSKIPEILERSDVFVFPSLGEGLSLSVLEAASCGLPLIVSENSGIDDAVSEGKEGFVIPIQSSDAILGKMQWFIEHPDQIEPMGKAARKMALHYTWEGYYKRMGRIFDEIVHSRGIKYGENSKKLSI